ncbi:hypothetical protein TNIN_118901 [Trichonephila inaurata madagascariensis]|uniref:Uncharacterized protein n=1 Tax=Trichonephila inaurata madagascariensis TaxID=2747483 RepID=A0A8X6YVQ7_9ARAC|nr:hypothetical protein TNIN_118901 [Trichonephila inaurata madagascariensis]
MTSSLATFEKRARRKIKVGCEHAGGKKFIVFICAVEDPNGRGSEIMKYAEQSLPNADSLDANWNKGSRKLVCRTKSFPIQTFSSPSVIYTSQNLILFRRDSVVGQEGTNRFKKLVDLVWECLLELLFETFSPK